MTTNRIAGFLKEEKKTPVKGTAILVTPRPRQAIGAKRFVKALGCALQGLLDAWTHQPNIRIHVYVGSALLVLGVACRLALAEWLWVCFAIGIVIFAELMNTAIEHAVDLVVGARIDPLATRIKDIAAGSVLCAAILAAVIETVVFLPHLLRG